MADLEASVDLSIAGALTRVAQLEAALKRATNINLGAAGGLSGGISNATKEIDKFDRSAQAAFRSFSRLTQVGTAMSTLITVPIVGATVASIAFATQFESSIVKLNTLAGVPQRELAGIRQALLDMAPLVGSTPKALSDGLFIVESSGIHGAAALDVVKLAAQGAALGLGDVNKVASAVTTILNAYPNSAITAAQATNVLVAATKEGKVNADEFAGQLGKVIEPASLVGINMGEVAGAVATLTRVTGSASIATTDFAGVLQFLIKPSVQAQHALADVGLSSQQLLDVIKNQGLLAALQLLKERFGDNTLALGQLFRNRTGLTGFLALTQDFQRTTEIFGETSKAFKSSGTDIDGFAVVSQTAAFKFKQAMAEVEKVGIGIGQKLAPALASAAKGAATFVGSFSDLPKAVQVGVGAVAGLAAIGGPILVAIGQIGKLRTAIQGLPEGSGIQKFSGAVVTGVGTATAAIGGFTSGLAIASENTATRVAGIAGSLASIGVGFAAGGPIGAAVAGVAAFGGALVGLSTHTTQAEKDMTKLKGAIDAIGNVVIAKVNAGTLVQDSEKTAAAAATVQTALIGIGSAVAQSSPAVQAYFKTINVSAASLVQSATPLEDLRRKLVELGQIKFAGNLVLPPDFSARVAGDTAALAEFAKTGGLTADTVLRLSGVTTNVTAYMGSSQAAALTYAKRIADLRVEQEKLAAAGSPIAGMILDQLNALVGVEHAAGDAGNAIAKTQIGYDAVAGAAKSATAAMILSAEQAEADKQATADLTAALKDTSTSFDAAATAADHMKSALDRVFKSDITAEDANVAYQKSIDDLTAAAAKNGQTLDITTEAGRANRKTVEDQVLAINTLIASDIGQGKSSADAKAAADERTTALVKEMAQFGLNEEQARAYIALLGSTPRAIETAIRIAEDEIAKKKLLDILAQLGDIDEGAAAKITALINHGDFDEANKALNALRDNAARLSATTYTVHVGVQQHTIVVNPVTGAVQDIPGFTPANGGFVGQFANGGLYARAARVPQIATANGARRGILWAEPETGWEAYISGKPSMRARNEQILAETARRFGMEIYRQPRRFDTGGTINLPPVTISSDPRMNALLERMSALLDQGGKGDVIVQVEAPVGTNNPDVFGARLGHAFRAAAVL